MVQKTGRESIHQQQTVFVHQLPFHWRLRRTRLLVLLLLVLLLLLPGCPPLLCAVEPF
jgi:hypothetical protein